jgi:hypothetical protein
MKAKDLLDRGIEEYAFYEDGHGPSLAMGDRGRVLLHSLTI